MLKVTGINAGYGKVQVLRDLSLSVASGEILCLLGRNGAGKTTLMKTIMGLIKADSGQIDIEGIDLTTLPAWQVPKHGVGYIPQGRRLFTEMTVAENLQIGLAARKQGPEVLMRVLDMFPRLRERLHQRAETLSGGEQQMLATARALCLKPKVLLLDEPTEGLQPSMISLIRNAVVDLKQQNVAIILVEQRVDAVLEIADRVIFIENGRAALEATPNQLRSDPSLIHKFVGV
ncbi:MAG: ABC transporter ATP-binding protein [Rhodobacterales bacterium]|jgi:branched-chain amino acid transport system ATP-binding protein|nr:ABC transporter ATP-binding protein [Pseudomonadota bacterium]MDA1286072.1 ABC transporter ATP-binding protein [Pseudomonadota bacterium]NQW15262.1 ABC transporter ATP-binding protein [Rhodobacter sp.]HBN30707.1 ABC transporter ATP-binding protein [Paracoccaceae bacterium]